MSPRRTLALCATLTAAVATVSAFSPAATAAPTALSVSNTAPIAPPDNTPAGVSSSIAVAGQTGLITDLDVTLTGVTSSYLGDLDVALVAPTGATVLVMSGACPGDDVANLTLTFDDEATASLSSSNSTTAPCTSGRFLPATTPNQGAGFPTTTKGSLAGFDGTSPNGTWRLVVADHSSTDLTTISGGFTLSMQVSDVTPPALTLGKAPKPSPKATQKVTFSADEPGSTFTCQIDKATASPCTSPLKLKKLAFGKHKVVVVAVDPSGNRSAPQTITIKRIDKK